MRKSPICGVCGAEKVERRGRLVCRPCSARSQREASARRGSPLPMTDAIREAKRKYSQKVRPSGLTNERVLKLRKLYGISEDTFISLGVAQDWQCAICKKEL